MLQILIVIAMRFVQKSPRSARWKTCYTLTPLSDRQPVGFPAQAAGCAQAQCAAAAPLAFPTAFELRPPWRAQDGVWPSVPPDTAFLRRNATDETLRFPIDYAHRVLFQRVTHKTGTWLEIMERFLLLQCGRLKGVVVGTHT